MQRKTDISGGVRPSGGARSHGGGRSSGGVHSSGGVRPSGDAHSSVGALPSGELSAWLSKYGPVEREIIESHERRLSGRARRRAAKARAFGDLCEATGGLAAVWRRDGLPARDMARWADGDVLTLLALARWLRRDATRRIDRARCRLRRPLYYAGEKARRQALAEERRRVGGRRTTNPCPSREDILDAWTRRRESNEAAVRFGSMIHDLECYVDNSLLRDGTGAIVGRRGGVKAWLQENIPALHVRYTTVMRYKAMAKKLRQVVGLDDPVPAEAVLATGSDMEGKKRDYGKYEICEMTANVPEVAVEGAKTPDVAVGMKETSNKAVERTKAPDVAVVRARAVWLEVVKDVRRSPTALMERLDALTDPERVEEANMLAGWKARYENEITASMKSRWWRKLARKRDVG